MTKYTRIASCPPALYHSPEPPPPPTRPPSLEACKFAVCEAKASDYRHNQPQSATGPCHLRDAKKAEEANPTVSGVEEKIVEGVVAKKQHLL